MSQEEGYNALYVPVNIKVRFEFVAGFGFSELAVTLIISAVIGAVVFLVSMFTNDPYNAILTITVTAAAVGMAVRKNEINQSVTDMVVLFIKYFNTQQSFPYFHYNRFKDGGNNND